MPTEPSLTSAVWRPEPLAEIIRRKLTPNLEHVTWREPRVTPSRLAISSRLIPSATNSLIFSITCGVNFMRLPLTDGLAFVIVIVMAAPLEVAQATRRLARAQARFLLLVFALLSSPSRTINKNRDLHFLDNFARAAQVSII